jgi:hypothetical protein
MKTPLLAGVVICGVWLAMAPAHAHAYTLVRQVLWPPAAVPRIAHRYFWPEPWLASSMPLRVSLVNLQKFTFQA